MKKRGFSLVLRTAAVLALAVLVYSAFRLWNDYRWSIDVHDDADILRKAAWLVRDYEGQELCVYQKAECGAYFAAEVGLPEFRKVWIFVMKESPVFPDRYKVQGYTAVDPHMEIDSSYYPNSQLICAHGRVQPGVYHSYTVQQGGLQLWQNHIGRGGVFAGHLLYKRHAKPPYRSPALNLFSSPPPTES